MNHDVTDIPSERNTIIVEDDLLKQGFTQVPNALLRLPGVTHGAKLTYALLLSYAWQLGSCFPGQEQLAQDLSVERKAVIRYLKELKDKQIIRVERRGMGKTNVYYLPKLSDVPKMGHQEVPKTGQQKVPSMGHKEYTMKKTQKEEYLSNIREANAIKTNKDTQRRTPSLPLPVHEVLNHRYTNFSVVSRDKETRDILQIYLRDVSRQFNDRTPASSLSRALNLLAKSRLSREAFLARMLEAVSLTKEQVSGKSKPIKRPMVFYFAVLTDLLGITTANG